MQFSEENNTFAADKLRRQTAFVVKIVKDMADKYQIPFINACIRALAKRVGLPVKSAFQYLDRFKGMEFLVDFYPTLHLQSLDDTVDDLIVMCKKNGGTLG